MNQRLLRRAALCATLALGCGVVRAADDAPAKPAAPSSDAAPQAAPRDFATVMHDIQEQSTTLRGVFSSPDVLTDPAKRQAAAAKAVPVLKKMIALFNELKDGSSEQGKMIAQQALPEFHTFLAVFDDDALKDLEQGEKDSDAAKALDAKGSVLLVHWIKSAKDAAAQEKLLGEAQALAKDNPSNEKLTGTLMAMSEFPSATPGMADKLKGVASNMTSPSAQQIKAQLVHDSKLKSLENKPLTIEGQTINGKKFSTADWKGKVIFVDFWATWCGPCRAELPRVKKAYADYHDKGLEVLGVSCDNDEADLKKFLADNKDMPWPQIFDAQHPGWNPLATSYGIDSIPTMFLIDKKGVVRTVTARENFEELIPKMLAEKD